MDILMVEKVDKTVVNKTVCGEKTTVVPVVIGALGAVKAGGVAPTKPRSGV